MATLVFPWESFTCFESVWLWTQISWIIRLKVLLISFVVCTLIYVAMAIPGYRIYGEDVQSQVTLNLPTEKANAKVAIYTILAGPVAKYVLTIMPIATSIENYLPVEYKDNKVTSAVIKMTLLASTVVLAIMFPSFESVASLSGAALVASVSFLIPCACYVKIFQLYRRFGDYGISIVRCYNRRCRHVLIHP